VTDTLTPHLATRFTREFGVLHPFVGEAFVAHERLSAAVKNGGGLGILGATRSVTDTSWGAETIDAVPTY